MKTLKLVTFILTVLALRPPGAHAELSSQLALEERIEKRVSRVVNAYDVFASIRVNISMKKLSAPLPGTAIDLTNFSGGESAGMEVNDISSVKITVASSKFPLPEWVKENVNAELSFLGGRKSVDYQQMSDAMRKDIEGNISSKEKVSLIAEGLFRKYSSFAEGLMTSVTMKIMMGFVFLVMFTLAAATGIAFWLSKKRMQELAQVFEAKIVPALQNIGGMGGGKMSTSVKIDGSSFGAGFAGNRNQNGQTEIEEISPHSLVAVFSDCYWCRFDSYAAWLWSAMSPSQRLSIFQSEFVDPEYLKYIQGLKKEMREDHTDPVYLEPLPIQQLSQEDLAKWVKSTPGSWHALSPMRQSTLTLSLQDRLKALSEPVKARASLTSIPDKKSTKRSLAAVKRIGEISHDDEVAILANPALIPEPMRANMQSLVWLALKPLEDRQKILGEWSAEELATAWSAAPAVLEKLMEALPEKKKQLLNSYLTTTKPTRDSETFVSLVKSGAGNGTNIRLVA
jgi:hypothetical protein